MSRHDGVSCDSCLKVRIGLYVKLLLKKIDCHHCFIIIFFLRATFEAADSSV